MATPNEERAAGAVTGAGSAAGTAFGFNKLLHSLTGFTVQRSFPQLRPRPFAVGWAAPQPIGLLPPRVLHLDRRWLGFTAHDVLQPITGQSEPQDLTPGTPAGMELYKYALDQSTAARGLSNQQLRKGVAAVERLRAGSVLGLPDKVEVQGQVFAGELTRRALSPGHVLQPYYPPGGGVGVRVVYSPLPASMGGPGVVDVNPWPPRAPITGSPPGPFTPPSPPAGSSAALAAAASAGPLKYKYHTPTGLTSTVGTISSRAQVVAIRGTRGRPLATDSATRPPQRKPGRPGLSTALAELPGAVDQSTTSDAVVTPGPVTATRHRGYPPLHPDPTVRLHIAQVRKGIV